MPFKPNYRFDRAERTRAKEARKTEKLETRAARKANRNASDSTAEAPDAAATKRQEDHDGVERTGEKKE